MSQQYVAAMAALSQNVSMQRCDDGIEVEKIGAGKGNRTPLASLEG